MRVATAKAESELSAFEVAHECDPVRYYQVSEYGFTAIRDLTYRSESTQLCELSN